MPSPYTDAIYFVIHSLSFSFPLLPPSQSPLKNNDFKKSLFHTDKAFREEKTKKEQFYKNF
jgi:hypothetical protein